MLLGWNRRALTVQSLRYANQTADVEVTFTNHDEILLSAKASGVVPWSAALKNAVHEITGELRVWDQSATLALTLGDRDWMPISAELQAKGWAIPAGKLKLGESYAMVRGDGSFKWNDGKFETSADVTGEKAAGKKAPPIAVKLHARGGFFVRPEVHFYMVHNNAEYTSPYIVRYGASIGYTFGEH